MLGIRAPLILCGASYSFVVYVGDASVWYIVVYVGDARV